MLRVRRAFIFCNDSASRRAGTRHCEAAAALHPPGQQLLRKRATHNGFGRWHAFISSVQIPKNCNSFMLVLTTLHERLIWPFGPVVFRVHPPVASSRAPRVRDNCQEPTCREPEREEHKRRGEHLHAESPSASSTSAVPPACARASAQLYCLGAVMSAPMSAVSGGCAALYKTSVEASSCREAHARSEYPTQ
jgi:hypothetical protein